jgi:ABC-type multidrug transport system fused ATPase/permease subunit
VENDMNAVERVLHYAHEIEQEDYHKENEVKPPSGWPPAGALTLNNVHMSYRPGLPTVLKGISMHIKSGEHIGIVGRTGEFTFSPIT